MTRRVCLRVTKFAYLKELVDPRVRKGIDGLPFTSEGYERAKNILQTNYGQTSEIINASGEGNRGTQRQFSEKYLFGRRFEI